MTAETRSAADRARPATTTGSGPSASGSPATETAGGAEADAPQLPETLVDDMLAWYREMQRDLPWRRSRDPYAILVSEIMLQQTRVETVLGRYESFLERFPTLAELAAAPLDDVLAEWSGLGYYRRPRSLHALARAVVDRHDGKLPESIEELLALPGLGPYTAAAVGSIAFGLPALSVDGNVGRILCRIAGIQDDFRRAPVRRRLEALVGDALRQHDPGELNQSIMELGARVCTPRAPECDECPAASWCAAHALGIEELIPPSNRQKTRAVTELAAVIERDGDYLMFRGQRPTLVADMWEFPTLDSRLAPRAGKATLQRHLESLGWLARIGAKLGEIRHGMTNRRITCRVYEATLTVAPSPARRHASGPLDTGDSRDAPGPPAAGDSRDNPVAEKIVSDGGHNPADPEPPPDGPTEHGWFTAAEAARLPLAASARKTLAELLETPPTST